MEFPKFGEVSLKRCLNKIESVHYVDCLMTGSDVTDGQTDKLLQHIPRCGHTRRARQNRTRYTTIQLNTLRAYFVVVVRTVKFPALGCHDNERRLSNSVPRD